MNSSEEFLTRVAAGDTARVTAMLNTMPSLAAARNAEGVSAPLLALYHWKREIAELLVSKKEALESLDVFEASAFGRVQTLAALLDKKAELVNAYAMDGFFPLGLAAFYGHEEAVGLLLSRGADVNLTSRNGMKVRALHAAAAARSLPIAKDLISAGASLDAAQQQGFRPLHEAAATGQLELVRLLLEGGADPNPRTDDGRCPLDLARKSKDDAMVQLLVTHGARD